MNKTVSSRQLGGVLKRLRERAGLSVRAVAAEVGYSPAKVTRQEQGDHVVSIPELSHLVIRTYGGTEEELARAEYYRQRAEEGDGWWIGYGTQIKDVFAAYLGLEDHADKVESLSLDVLNGLLQTQEYATAIYNFHQQYSLDRIEQIVDIRMKRQLRLTDTERPLTVHAVISESALHRCGSQYNQLEHLIQLAKLPNVTIQVLPFSAGIHAHVVNTSLVTLPSGSLPPVIYVDGPAEYLIEDERETAKIRRRFDRLHELASTPEASIKHIQQMIEAM
jgi:transcriptional regulator with XRE-family HTH domain